MFITEEEALKQFKELFLKSKGLLHKNNTSLIDILNLYFEKTFKKEVILKYIATEYYLKPEALSQEEKDVFKSSPWFPELRLNLKYPTVFDVISHAKSPNSNWVVYLRENKNSFLVFWENEYITQLTLDYKVNGYALWKDYLVLIDESKVLRVIYLYSLKEVHKKEGKGFKEVKSDKERLYLIYENGIIQAFKVNEIGIIFGEVVQEIKKSVEYTTTDSKASEKLKAKVLKVSADLVNSLSFSPDGKMLAVSVSNEKKVMVFSTNNFKKIWEVNLNSSPNQVKFSPDGKYLAVGCNDSYAYIYDVLNNFEEKHKFKSPKGWVVPVSFSPDGNLFAFGGKGYLGLYNFNSGNEVFKKEYGNNVLNISFSPSGKYLAVGISGGRVEVLYTGVMVVVEFKDYIGSYYRYTLSFSPDGRFLAYTTNNNKVKLLSVEDWQPVKEIDGLRFAFSDDGKYIFTTLNDKVMVWDLEEFEKITEYVPYEGGNIYSIAVNSKVGLISCGYEDGNVYLLKYDEFESSNQLEKVAYSLKKVLWTEPYIIFIDENKQAYMWQQEEDGFVYKLYIGELNPSQEFKDLQALNVEGWRVEKDFILFKDGKVAGSKGFQKHVNVLLGSNLVSFEEFKGIILTKPLEVLV